MTSTVSIQSLKSSALLLPTPPWHKRVVGIFLEGHQYRECGCGGHSPASIRYLSRPAKSGRAVSVERRSKWADAGTRGGSIIGLRPMFYL